MIQNKSFGDKWGDWVMKTMKGGNVAIKTNDTIGPFFPTHKGVRQGDPFSPLLFNIAANGVACLIEKAQEMNLIGGLIPHILDNGCAYLQYADDTILLLQDNLEFAKNLKFILILFEKCLGLKLIFRKAKSIKLIFKKAKSIALVTPLIIKILMLRSLHAPLKIFP
jgi:hypothetical protein